MTFYELIRKSLLEDAEKNPYPGKGDGLSLLLRKQEEPKKEPEGK